MTAGLVIMTLASIGVGLYAFAFQARLKGDPAFHIRFDPLPLASAMHVLGGGTLLRIGALQFWTTLRQRFPALHRWVGRVYLSLVVVGGVGVGGLILSTQATGGLVARFGFGLLAVIWLYSGAQAYLAIHRRDIATHRDWMIRNFALALAAVTLRIYLGLFALAGVPFQ